jgi:lipopolysaccharide transport system ATP-binding protein
MSDIAIRVSGLSKQYRIGVREPYHNLRDTLARAWSAPYRWLRQGRLSQAEPAENFWALKDVSFEVKRGEVVGIIGRNGGGKSTLLKILSRITEPTIGEIRIFGRVGSLLEVGTGFHPELTGRENVYLNGAILGMRRAEIARKFDEIVAFAEIDKFMDTPVKHYSSGMYMRLAFAVAAHMEPEVLIVDEVLAVGDATFQQKCLGKLQTVSQQGRTVLFVTHNMQAVSSLCDRGIYMQKGEIKYIGSSEKAIQCYLTSAGNAQTASWEGDEGDDDVRLLGTRAVSGEDGTFRTDEPLRVWFCFIVRRPILGLIRAVEVFNEYQQRLVYSAIDDSQPPPATEVKPGKYKWKLTIPPNTFAAGRYRIVFDIGIHNVRRIIKETGSLSIQLENVKGIGRRFLAYENLIRPDWRWVELPNSGDDQL